MAKAKGIVSRTQERVAAAREARKHRRPSWFDALPPDQQSELLDLQSKVISGEVKLGWDYGPKRLLQDLKEDGYDIDIGVTYFGRWIKGQP